MSPSVERLGGARRAAVLIFTVVAVVAGLTALACGDDTSSDRPDPPEPPPAADQTCEISGVDTSELDSAGRRLWCAEVNEQTSPCGQPVNLVDCVANNIGCAACAPAARYLARLAAEGAEREELRESFRARYGEDSEIEIDLADAPIRGSVMAPVTIVEFSDFQCPFCGRAHVPLKRIVDEFPGQVRVVFRHYPLGFHEHAGNAAVAAEAAGAQGKFWEMHDQLFEHQAALEPSDILEYARGIGLDMERFQADFESEELRARVERSRAIGQNVGVDSTPSIYVNGRALPAGQLDQLVDYVREELAAQ